MRGAQKNKLISALIFSAVLLFIIAFYIASNYQPQNNYSPPTTCQFIGCSEGTQFVGSINSKVYHDCSCSAAQRINTENLICFADKASALEQGYRASKVC